MEIPKIVNKNLPQSSHSEKRNARRIVRVKPLSNEVCKEFLYKQGWYHQTSGPLWARGFFVFNNFRKR